MRSTILSVSDSTASNRVMNEKTTVPAISDTVLIDGHYEEEKRSGRERRKGHARWKGYDRRNKVTRREPSKKIDEEV